MRYEEILCEKAPWKEFADNAEKPVCWMTGLDLFLESVPIYNWKNYFNPSVEHIIPRIYKRAELFPYDRIKKVVSRGVNNTMQNMPVFIKAGLRDDLHEYLQGRTTPSTKDSYAFRSIIQQASEKYGMEHRHMGIEWWELPQYQHLIEVEQQALAYILGQK